MSAAVSRAESFRVANLHTDTIDLSGTTLTVTAAEINILDGVTATAAEINKLAGAGAVVASGTQGGTVTIITATQAGTAANIAAEFASIWSYLAAFKVIAGTA